MTKETAFQTLGVSKDASPQEIKQAWRDMLSVWHPDKHMGNERLRRKAEEQTKRINEAYNRIQTGNFKSSNRPQSESPPYEDFRQAHRQAYEDYIRRAPTASNNTSLEYDFEFDDNCKLNYNGREFLRFQIKRLRTIDHPPVNGKFMYRMNFRELGISVSNLGRGKYSHNDGFLFGLFRGTITHGIDDTLDFLVKRLEDKTREFRGEQKVK